jgi:cell division protein FtsN
MNSHRQAPHSTVSGSTAARGLYRGSSRGRPLRGGFAAGLVVGLLVGLALALGVALYVTKVPVPFINKVPQRTAEQDSAETERNKNWEPNAPLVGKAPARAAAAGATVALPATAAKASVPLATADLPPAPAARAAASAAAPAASKPKTAAPGGDPMIYFAQVGAYTRAEDAEAQRAKLALLGVDTKLSERDQSGRTIYRVRAGPFEARAQADAMLERLQAAGVESALVRVERQ